MAKSAETKPSSRTYKSENRERSMRKLAVRMLRSHGYKIINERTPAGQQFVDVRGPGGAMTVWVKCAWRPGRQGHSAVQIDFPKTYEQTSAWAIKAVQTKVAKTKERGATHMMLLGANVPGTKATAAYLARLVDIPNVFRRTVKFHPKMARNGKSPCLYVEGPSEPHRRMIAPLASVSVDLLSDDAAYADQHGELKGNTPPGVEKPERIQTKAGTFLRDPAVRRYVLRRARGRCEYCGKKGFKTMTGAFYLETHHIVALGKRGKDTVDNVIALCPGHHREAHHGENLKSLSVEMLEKFSEKI